MPSMNLKKLWRRKSVEISGTEETYKVHYLGNVLTEWAKGEGCVDKPLAALWRNYCHTNRHDIPMRITVCGSGLRAFTKEHGLIEYWAHRVTYCAAHPAYPRVFCWIYRHEGRRMKPELRCHAVVCSKAEKAKVMSKTLQEKLALALHEFRREKMIRQNARLSVMTAIYNTSNLPMRRMGLVTGSSNYRPPLERSKSAPKLGAIEELQEEEEEESRLCGWTLDRPEVFSRRDESLFHSSFFSSRLQERHRSPFSETIPSKLEPVEPEPGVAVDLDNHGDIFLLSSFKEHLNIRHVKDDSLISDQPDSISSDSCSSSCKDSDESEDRILSEKRRNTNLKGDLEEEDNISEESGYSEGKDCLVPNETTIINVV